LATEVLVVELPERVDVERDAVSLVLEDAGLPDCRDEVLLLDLQRLRDVVEREDDLAEGHPGELVHVHRGDVRALAALNRGRELLVEVSPLDGVLLDRDVLVLGLEVRDELLHERTVTTGEAVPVLELDGRALVLAGEVLGRRGLRSRCLVGVVGGLASAATSEQDACPRAGAERQEGAAIQPGRLVGGRWGRVGHSTVSFLGRFPGRGIAGPVRLSMRPLAGRPGGARTSFYNLLCNVVKAKLSALRIGLDSVTVSMSPTREEEGGAVQSA
jgi:hypothetical protein